MDIFRNTDIIRKARKNEEGMLIKPNFSLNQNEDPKDSYKLDELSKTSKKMRSILLEKSKSSYTNQDNSIT